MIRLKSTTRAVAAVMVLATLAFGGRGVQAQPEHFRLDPAHTSIAFMVDHIGFEKLIGMFLEVEGTFRYDEKSQKLTDLVVKIPAKSVFSNHQARDTHVRSDEFLDAATHPDITFKMTAAKAASETTGTVTGELTIRGVTQPVTLDVTLNKIGDYPFPVGGKVPYVIGFSARTTIKRSDFGMTYAVENGLVGDEVQILIEAEAARL